MRLALLGDIQELHVRESLARALTREGVAVAHFPLPWPPGAPARESAVLDGVVDEVLAWGPTATFVFRPAALRRRDASRLRDAGVTQMAWFSDDPILYPDVYRAAARNYDIVLNCGNAQVLEFYRGKNGYAVNFPFWADGDEFPHVYRPDACATNFVFFGNVHTQTKRRRLKSLEPLGAACTIIGKRPAGPEGPEEMSFADPRQAAHAVARGRIAINIPQFFADYRRYWTLYPEIGMLGFFDIPSRLVQYAAWGLPTVTLGAPFEDAHMPSVRNFPDVEDLIRAKAALLGDGERLMRWSQERRQEFERGFEARARARFLLALVRGEASPWRLSPAESLFAYRDF